MRRVYRYFGLCCSPVQNDASHKSTVRYNLTGKAVGMSGLTCYAVKLNGEEISSKSEEVQVYFQFEGVSQGDLVDLYLQNSLLRCKYYGQSSDWKVHAKFKMYAVIFLRWTEAEGALQNILSYHALKFISSICFFFSIGVFFHGQSRITGLQGKGEDISLTPHYHFHPFHRHLDISGWLLQRAHLCT